MRPPAVVTASALAWRRLLLPVMVLLLALGVLGMHSLAGSHHGLAAAPVDHRGSLGATAADAGSAVSALGAHAETTARDHGSDLLRTAAGALSGVVGAVGFDGMAGAAGGGADGSCDSSCAEEGALLAVCLVILVIAVALGAARARAWTSLPATVWAPAPLLLPRVAVLPRGPARFQLCISRT